MIINDENLLYIFKYPENKQNISKARKLSREYRMQVNGTHLIEFLDKIDGYENKIQRDLKIKLVQSQKDKFQRILNPAYKIFSADGENEEIKASENITKDFKKLKSQGYSLKKWFKNIGFNKFVTDPNGLFFVENENGEPYITYKSIDCIYDYMSDGLKLEYVIFEPVIDNGIKYFRVVDDNNDLIVSEIEGNYQIVDNVPSGMSYRCQKKLRAKNGKLSFYNVWNEVPARFCSDIAHPVYNIKNSIIDTSIEIARERFNVNNTRTINLYLHLYPIFWKYLTKCPECNGTGYIEGKKCKACKGTGQYISKNIVDTVGLSIPETTDEPIITPNVAGYVSPPIESFKAIREELKEQYEDIEYAVWGTKTIKDLKNVTATGVYANQEIFHDKINDLSDWLEYAMSDIGSIIGRMKYGEDFEYSYKAGRRYRFESADALLTKYGEFKKNNYPSPILDYYLNEYLISENRNTPETYNYTKILLEIEPYPHNSIQEVISWGVLSQRELYKKIYFQEWKATLTQKDHIKSKEELITEFENYINQKLKENDNEEILQ